MKRPASQAFTLIELIVVIGIIAVLTGISLPIFNSVTLSGQRTQSLSNMRQFGVMFISYCNDNNGQVPAQYGTVQNPQWNDTTLASEAVAWYNVLPRTYGSSKGVGDYAVNSSLEASFYKRGCMFFVPAAKYPSSKLTVPMLAFTYNSKLIDKTYDGNDATLVRLQNFQTPASTCVFQESGVGDNTAAGSETNIRGQKIYNTTSGFNQPYTYASRTVARYNGQTIIVYADGHSGLVTGTEIVATSGKSYIPQIGSITYSSTGTATTILSSMSWTPNPTNDATQ